MTIYNMKALIPIIGLILRVPLDGNHRVVRQSFVIVFKALPFVYHDTSPCRIETCSYFLRIDIT